MRIPGREQSVYEVALLVMLFIFELSLFTQESSQFLDL